MVRPMIDTATMPIRTTFRRFSPFALMTCCAALWLAGCAQKPITIDAPPPSVLHSSTATPAPLADGHSAQNSLDWAGSYQAVLPCQGCPGTAIRVQLRSDMTATVMERRLGTPANEGAAETYHGPFTFGQGAQANLISLAKPHEQVPAYRFFVSEGWIELRDRATGAPLSAGTQHRLRRTNLP